ncbi:MAG: hypothetical protein N2037_10160 [Acidimicrobiales bacterium]|nr:hypothetical protein [Acidimicrobiales bacterium]
MAAQTFEQLLSSIGFPAAEGAAELGMIERKKALGKANIEMMGEEERRQMAADFEGRGVLLSGEANLGYARQAAREANRLTELDIAAADDTLALARRLQRAQAEKEAADREFALRQRMFDESMALQREQLATMTKLSRDQLNAEIERQRLQYAPKPDPMEKVREILRMYQQVDAGLRGFYSRLRGW